MSLVSVEATFGALAGAAGGEEASISLVMSVLEGSLDLLAEVVGELGERRSFLSRPSFLAISKRESLRSF